MSQGKILIIDGDVMLSEMLKARLKAEGFLVSYARDGREALGIIKTEWIDLIVMAVILQGDMNGYRFLKQIRRKKEFYCIPVIIQSSKSGMKETFKRMGVKDFFVKPYSVDKFLNRIKDLLK